MPKQILAAIRTGGKTGGKFKDLINPVGGKGGGGGKQKPSGKASSIKKGASQY